MAIRKFIEELGTKIIPTRRSNNFAAESADSIRRHLLSQLGNAAPSDLVVVFDDTDDKAIIGGTVRDDRARQAIVETAGNIQGVEKVDDRMVSKG